jgi:glycolate oxidase FAD binding subunit
MLAEVPGQRLDNAQTAPDWGLCRNQQLPFFVNKPQPDAVLWRLSVPQTAPVLRLPGHPLVEWHGGLRWLWAPLAAQAELQAVTREAGGSAAVFAAGSAADNNTPFVQGTAQASSLLPADPALDAISQRLKASFDPQGIFNPGLTPDANQSRA